MTGMFVLANRILLRHKKSVELMLAAVLLNIAVIGTVDNSINQTIIAGYEKETERVGAHHVIVYNLDDGQRNLLDAYPGTTAGFVQAMPCTIPEKDTEPVCAGFADPAFEEIGKITTLTGQLPRAEGEAALERHFSDRYGYKAGDHMVLLFGKEERSYDIVGIISDYSTVWSTWDEGKDGSKTMPQILLGGAATTAYSHAIIKFQKNPMDDHFDDIMGLVRTLENDTYILNQKLFMSQTMDEITNLNMIRWIVVFCMGIAMLMIDTNLIQLYLSSIMPQRRIMRQLGKTRRFQRSLLAIQFCEMGAIIAIGALGLSVALRSVFHADTVQAWIVFTPALVFIAVAYLQWLQTEQRMRSEEKPKRIREYLVCRNVPLMIALNDLKTGFYSYAGIIFALAVCISVTCFGIQYNRELGETPPVSEDFAISAPQMITAVEIDGMEAVMNGNECITWEIYDQICRDEEVCSVSGDVQTLQSMLMLNNEMVDLTVHALSKEEYEQIRISSPMLTEGTQFDTFCALVLPDGMQTIMGKEIELAYMRYEGEMDGQYIGKRFQKKLYCSRIIGDCFGNAEEGEKIDVPTLFVSIPFIRNTGIYPGFSNLEINMIPGAKAETVKAKLENLMAAVPNSEVFDINEYYERNRKMGEMIRNMTMLCCAVLGVYSLAMILLVFHIRWIQNKYTIGIYRILGCSKKDLTGAMLIENMAYLLAAFLCSGCFLVCLSAAAGWGMYYVKYAGCLLALSAIILATGEILILYSTKRMLRTEPALLMRVDE